MSDSDETEGGRRIQGEKRRKAILERLINKKRISEAIDTTDKCIPTGIGAVEAGPANHIIMGIQFHQQDYVYINSIFDHPNIFALLVHSLCPNLHGHVMVKAALILSLFAKQVKNANLCNSNIHILLVGDPGCGKSQLLQACVNIAPKTCYVDEKSYPSLQLGFDAKNDSNYETGALVLANDGFCCINEFDKIANQQQVLLQVMRRQHVNVVKPERKIFVPARTTILATITPNNGYYDRSKTLQENLSTHKRLLSAFNLVLILTDRSDEEDDGRFFEYVMSLRQCSQKSKKRSICSSSSSTTSKNNCESHNSLRERLSARELLDHLPQELFRKYVAYAQQYIVPKIPETVNDVINKFYLELNEEYRNHPTSEVSFIDNQLLTLVELTKARAKLELRSKTTLRDVFDALEVMKYASDEQFVFHTFPNAIHPQSNLGKLTQNKAKRFLTLLTNEAARKQKNDFTKDELYNIGRNGNLQINNMFELIEKLNHEGFLLKLGSKSYKLISN
ncbi:DNA helicase MCM8 [Orussus abietinus]|uniref:DNA helicase MCM8 n=1 Tax=Orussus abietinus TaxID=222816 RepID=UPI0006258496|nr:DNA helicase MCM8 [Orussus abietinus]